MKKILFLLCAFLFFNFSLFAQIDDVASYEEIMAQVQSVSPELQAFIDADFSEYSESDIINAFIDLSGESDRRQELLDFYFEQAEQIDTAAAWALVAEGVTSESSNYNYKLADALNMQMHKVSFKNYNKNTFTLAEIKDHKMYDCVSATVFYAALLRRHFVPGIPIESVDHVLMAIPFAERRVYVETTSCYGFDPGTKKEFQSNMTKSITFNYVMPGSKKAYGEMNIKQLLSKVVQNRVYMCTKNKQYLEAAQLAYAFKLMCNDENGEKSYQTALGNLTNVMSASNNRLRRFEESYKWIEPLEDSQNKVALLNNAYLAVSNNVEKTGNYQQGFDNLDLSLKYGVTAKNKEYLRFRTLLVNNYCVSSVQQRQYEDAKSLLQNEMALDIIPRPDLLKLYRSACVKQANELSKANQNRQAIEISLDCLELMPKDNVLANNLKVYYKKYIEYLAMQDPEEAKKVIEEARQRFPNEKVFTELTGLTREDLR